MEKLTLARHAMKTRFEFVLTGANSTQLRGAGEEALDEIERIEGRLNLYDASSEIAQVNARASHERVRLSPEVFHLLERAREYHVLTRGSFDPAVAPLVRCWGFMKGSGSRPGDQAIAETRELVGFDRVELDPADCTVSFARPGMMLDLGSIGKGYALDCAAEILREAGVEHALLHGGTSTIVGLGSAPGGAGWRVAIEDPTAGASDAKVISVVELHNESLSVSAVRGKFFEIDGKTYGHVLDPRTGWPAENALLGAVILPTAAATDALSTAILLGSEAELAELSAKVPGIRYLQVKSGQPYAVVSRGIRIDKSLDTPAAPSV